ncbi:Uu.00g066590.m01.CDS01 [Anthostomella pinea]|uniref:Uu.00g066590.m01.CDS01 n=1 Tax=Anthostomella pinea TaxID=933095 RepID=A0AAI8VU09_9PEZI|nr:Uu.00g066590.m01.CDS01 [Anthostomella pinea]
MAFPPHAGGSGAPQVTPAILNESNTPTPPGVRPTLPHRGVTSETIDDAYVSFILYCNPAVPMDVDDAGLREAFRTPPKSEGKSFSTFTLFELIMKLHHKEIKTWAELALRLGVEPPDQDKGQSSQKIQQYAVRLKRWMHSMHVDAFFDYLLNNFHPYWTNIPTNPNPVCGDGRDGVAAEDDMALRALLPHIRPRRGRKRPEEDGLNKSPSQRPRLGSLVSNGDVRQSRPDTLEPWTAHPDARLSYAYSPIDPRSSVLPTPESAFPWHRDIPRGHTSAYPQSAITPSTRGAFWPDLTEPLSAISPPKNRLHGRRHGAKAVSSAWRNSNGSASGKARGRPPINRITESPLSAYPHDTMGFQVIDPEQIPRSTATPQLTYPQEPAPESEPVARISEPTSAQSTRPSRPGRLSLQVPERAGGPVRLATPPPPVVMVNGKHTTNETNDEALNDTAHGTTNGTRNEALNVSAHDTTNGTSVENATTEGGYPTKNEFKDYTDRSTALFVGHNGNPQPKTGVNIHDEDKTNHAVIEALFVAVLLETQWYDKNGVACPPGGIDEMLALGKTMIQDIADRALTKEAFLINVSALAGGSFMYRSSTRTVKLEEIGPDYTKYLITWNLRYGSIIGDFTMTQVVPHSLWKKGHQKPEEPLSNKQVPTEPAAAAAYWQKKYGELVSRSKLGLVNQGGLKKTAIQLIKEIVDTESLAHDE